MVKPHERPAPALPAMIWSELHGNMQRQRVNSAAVTKLIIYNISPTDTPFINNIGRGTCDNTYFEWQEDELAAVDTGNAAVEGADAGNASTVPTTRVGNYTQISTKVADVSGSLETVDKAGRSSEMSYQLAKKGAELKRDMEAILSQNQAATAGNASNARKTAAIESWMRGDSALRGSGGADPTMSGSGGSGYPDSKPTDGTQRAFTESLLQQALANAWENGANPSIAMVGPANKQKFSEFSGIATLYRDTPQSGQASIIGAADIYVGDFGEISVVPSRFMRGKSALILDPDFIEVSYLRPFQTIDLARTGDSMRKEILVEYGLKVNNHEANAIVADLKTSY